MSSEVVIEAHEGAALKDSLSLSPVLGDVLGSPVVRARLPKDGAGKFLSLARSRSAKRPTASTLVGAATVLDALKLLASILDEERSLDVLVCEDATTGELLERASFDAGPRYVHADLFHTRDTAEHALRSIPGVPAEGPVPDLVLPGFTHRRRVIDGVEREVRDALPVRLRWRSAIACHPAQWTELHAFVAAHPSATFRLGVG
jgi:hypothetical protein